MPDQFRAILAIILVGIILIASSSLAEKAEREVQNPDTDAPVYSEIQHSALCIDDSLDWGLTFTAEDVTNTGLTLICEQSGGDFTGVLDFGAEFSLEKLDGAKWIICKTTVPEEELAWTQELYVVQINDSIRCDVDWTGYYGELKSGSYRITKTVKNDTASNTYFAYFTVK